MKPNFNNFSDIIGLRFFTKEICPYYYHFLQTRKDSGGASIHRINKSFPLKPSLNAIWHEICRHLHTVETYNKVVSYTPTIHSNCAAVARGVKPAIINRVFFFNRPSCRSFFISLAMKVFLTPGKTSCK